MDVFFFPQTPWLAFYKVNLNIAVYPEDNAKVFFFVVTSIIHENYHPQEWLLLVKK